MAKGALGWINTTLTDSDYPLNADHFPVSFETTPYNNLLQFYPRFWKKKIEIVTFQAGEKKVLVIQTFNIKIIRKSPEAV